MAYTAVPTAEPNQEARPVAAVDSDAANSNEISPQAVADSPEAAALRAEIIAVGRKLWERQYVDGNGGNISVRLGSKYVLCTPTMMCKRDMEPADICLSDLEGNILAGDRRRTSELLLHLTMYKANSARPRHCALPSATCDGLRHDRHGAAHRADFGVRDLDRPRGGGAL